MIRIYNNILPLKGFKAMNICGILLVRKGKVMTDKNIRHEQIHTEQMKEMLYIDFYLWYVIEWLIRLILCMSAKRARMTLRQAARGFRLILCMSAKRGRMTLRQAVQSFRLILCMSAKRAYYSISFEKEAYKYQEDVSYLERRRRYEWLIMMIDE